MAAVMAATGCGFEPVLRKGSPAAALPGNFRVSVPGRLMAFQLQEQLDLRLGTASGEIPDYLLHVHLDVSERKAAAAGSGGVNRLALNGIAEYRVESLFDEAMLAEGSVRGSVTFSSTNEIIASDAARADAVRRLVNLLAERIVARLTQTAGDWAVG